MLLRPRLSRSYVCVEGGPASNVQTDCMVLHKYARSKRAGVEPALHYESEGRGFDSLRAHHHQIVRGLRASDLPSGFRSCETAHE